MRRSNCERDRYARFTISQPCFLHLFLLAVHSHNAGAGLRREIPVAATSLQHVARPGLPKAGERSTVARAQVEAGI